MKQVHIIPAYNHKNNRIRMKILIKYVIGAFLCYLVFSYLGCKKESFTTNYPYPSAGDTITLAGIYNAEEGDSALNSVFIDFSKGTQTAVLRSAWDLGLYSGTDTNKVIINHSRGATVVDITASASKKTDWANVGTADSSSYATANALNTFAATTTATFANVDPVVGDKKAYLAGTIIQMDHVYILNRGTMNLPLLQKPPGMKIKISATANGYSIQYGLLAATVANTVTIIKDGSYNFNYVSFNSSTTTVEPGKTYWDLEYTATTYLNPNNTALPIGTTDFMMINFMGGVTAAQIIPGSGGISSTISYATVTGEDVKDVTYSATRDVIGTNWRTLVGSVSYVSINTDRFYLIKDTENNIYAVSFAGGGSRGKPIVEYRLISSTAKTGTVTTYK